METSKLGSFLTVSILRISPILELAGSMCCRELNGQLRPLEKIGRGSIIADMAQTDDPWVLRHLSPQTLLEGNRGDLLLPIIEADASDCLAAFVKGSFSDDDDLDVLYEHSLYYGSSSCFRYLRKRGCYTDHRRVFESLAEDPPRCFNRRGFTKCLDTVAQLELDLLEAFIELIAQIGFDVFSHLCDRWEIKLRSSLFASCMRFKRESLLFAHYLHDCGLRWNGECTLAAIERDDVELLRYLIEGGCPWNRKGCLSVATGECREYLQTLRPKRG